ncbi:MAG: DUF349 domain-containing protein [Tannerella sp.]|jgi:hypothetical protein|nr:DUF349 domain-containing protein [Tannerella sp.]
MMDTQETNLPKEEKESTEETGKLEESQAPEVSPEVTTAEPDKEVEEVITQAETNVEATATEVDEQVEAPAPLEAIVEEAVAEVEESADSEAPADAVVETPGADSEAPADAAGETPGVESETPVEAVAEEPEVEESADSEAPADAVVETPGVESETPVEAVAEEPEVEESADSEAPADAAIEAPGVESETPVEAVAEEPEVEESADSEVSADAAVEAPGVESETPVEAVVEEPEVEESADSEAPVVTEEFGEDASDEDAAPEPEVSEGMIAPLDAVALAIITKQEIIERLKRIVAEPKRYTRNEADVLKQTYYKLRRIEVETMKKEFLEGGGEENAFVIPEDETETQLKSLISEYKEKRASMAAEEERLKEENYVFKQHLIERLKALTESQDDFNKRYNEFREIQRKWKEIKSVPQDYAKELWRKYQLYNERFYDIVKINNQFRDYDFKKNLELKTALCEAVERLDSEADVVSAFHQLQKLHQQWREIGPVAKEFRDSIWDRFKEASTVINKKHQAHFESLKANEEKNLEEKIAICEQIEHIDSEALKTMRDWEKKTEEVIALQAKWRTIGFATKKQNVKIFERFRAACDAYFNKKSEFYKSVKQEMDKNLELKKALVEKAESMKDRTDWKDATKAFVEIQNEWKKIGPVARKYSESVWRQFIAACDYFFEQKNKEMSSQKSEENDNLEAKKALIEKIRTIDENMADEDALSTLRKYISDWGSIGFVPFREKDKLYKSFREAVDKQFDRLKVNERDRRVQQFRSNLTELAGVGKNKLYSERDRLMRVYERMKNELQTYENNIGFFNISSKGGDGLLKEMDRKIDRLREEMEIVVKKIEAIDENLE